MPFLEMPGHFCGEHGRDAVDGKEADAVVFFDNRRELRYCCISHDSLHVRELR